MFFAALGLVVVLVMALLACAALLNALAERAIIPRVESLAARRNPRNVLTKKEERELVRLFRALSHRAKRRLSERTRNIATECASCEGRWTDTYAKEEPSGRRFPYKTGELALGQPVSRRAEAISYERSPAPAISSKRRLTSKEREPWVQIAPRTASQLVEGPFIEKSFTPRYRDFLRSIEELLLQPSPEPVGHRSLGFSVTLSRRGEYDDAS